MTSQSIATRSWSLAILLVVQCGVLQAQQGRPPDPPRDRTALLMHQTSTDEAILRARVDALVKERRRALRDARREPRRLYGRLPKPPYGQRAVAHLDPARAHIEAVRLDIDRWIGAIGSEEAVLMMWEDTRTTVADMIVNQVLQSERAETVISEAYERAQAGVARLEALRGLNRREDRETLRLADVRAHALVGRFEALRRAQRTRTAILDALDQGRPDEYRARLDTWRASGRAAASQRAAAERQAQERFTAAMAGFFFGVPAAAVEAQRANSVARERAKLADPNYDQIMMQTRLAFRQACEAEGGIFEDGTGDEPGRCRPR